MYSALHVKFAIIFEMLAEYVIAKKGFKRQDILFRF